MVILTISTNSYSQKYYQPIKAKKEIIFEDEFNEDKGHWKASAKGVKYSVKNGQLRIKTKGSDAPKYSALICEKEIKVPKNWEMEVSFRWNGGNKENRVGAYFGVENDSGSKTGFKAKYSEIPHKTWVDIQKSKTYVLKVVQFNGKRSAYVNNKKISATDGQFEIGHFAVGLPSPNITTHYAYRTIPIRKSDAGKLDINYVVIYGYDAESEYVNEYGLKIASARIFDRRYVDSNNPKNIIEIKISDISKWRKEPYKKLRIGSISGFRKVETVYGDERWYSQLGDSYPSEIRVNIALQTENKPSKWDRQVSLKLKLNESEIGTNTESEKISLPSYEISPTKFDEATFKRFVSIGDNQYKKEAKYDKAFRAYNYANKVGFYENKNCNKDILDAAMSLIIYGYDSDLLFTTLKYLKASNVYEANARDYLLIRRYWLMNDRSFRKNAKELLQENPDAFSSSAVDYLKSISSLEPKRLSNFFKLEDLSNIAFLAKQYELSANFLKEKITNSEKLSSYEKFKLGILTRYGIVFQKNLQKARELLLEACSEDIYESCRVLLEDDDLDAKYIIAWDFDVNYDQEEAQTFFYNILQKYNLKDLNRDSRWTKSEERERYHRLYSYETVTYSREIRQSTEEAFGYESGNYVYKTESYNQKESIRRRKPLTPLTTTDSGLLSLYIDFHNLNRTSTTTDIQQYLRNRE